MKKLMKVMMGMLAVIMLGACADKGSEPADTTEAEAPTVATDKTFKIGAIPDFNATELNDAFGDFAEYLSAETGLDVEFVPTPDYAALVTGFERGEIDMGWFGGLTGVQVMNAVPEAEAIAQRPQDAEFQSVFIKHADVEDVAELTDIVDHTFTFGSESSTSGHLMPRFFMTEAGINPDEDLADKPNYSGSHDRTYKLVESGAFQIGVVNMQYWDQAVADGEVDDSLAVEFYRTPEYFDYNWTINNVDAKFGEGTKEKVKDVLLAMKKGDSKVMELLSADEFIETENANYDSIKEVATELNMLNN